jgi:hypothetical protein
MLSGLVTVTLSPGIAGAAVTAGDVFVSAEVTGCTSVARRASVALLDDAWRTASAAADLTVFRRLTLGADGLTPATTLAANPSSFSFVGSGETGSVAVSLQNVPAGPISIGTAATQAGIVGLSANREMQGCASYPSDLYGASAATTAPFWNEGGGTSTSLNAVLFDFSTPVRAFGAWFGDLESSTSTPAQLALFDASGNLLFSQDVLPTGACPGTPPPGSACSDQSTRWLGFVAGAGDAVSKMLVVVGGTDVCPAIPTSSCRGLLNSVSFVGATIGEPDPTATTSTSTSTSSTSTSSTSTSTTVESTTSPSSTSTTTVATSSSSSSSSTTTTVEPSSSTSSSSTSTTSVTGAGQGVALDTVPRTITPTTITPTTTTSTTSTVPEATTTTMVQTIASSSVVPDTVLSATPSVDSGPSDLRPPSPGAGVLDLALTGPSTAIGLLAWAGILLVLLGGLLSVFSSGLARRLLRRHV